MELSFENLLAHINTVYILVTKEKKSDQSSDKAVPSLATWRHHEDGTEIIQEANLRLKVNQTEITPPPPPKSHSSDICVADTPFFSNRKERNPNRSNDDIFNSSALNFILF
jgi:hypothetical protein